MARSFTTSPCPPKLRELLTDLGKQHGPGLIVVDQPNTIGALPVGAAQDHSVDVAYLTGLTMRRVADLHPGQAKTDARDAFIIADTARTMPHTLHNITVTEENTAELSMICGFDDDLTAQATQVSNRMRGLLTQIHPALERALGPRLHHRAVVDLHRLPQPVRAENRRQGPCAGTVEETRSPPGIPADRGDLQRPRRTERYRRWHGRGSEGHRPTRCAAGPAARSA